MDRSQATSEAFDGVELRLLNERVVRCKALEVSEAVRYLRLLGTVSEDFRAHHEFMAEFPERIQIADVPLRDLGFSMPGPDGELDGNGVTVEIALGHLRMLVEAEQGDPRAQSKFLDRFPPALGVEPSELIPSDVFELGRTFAQEVYALIYGLASDFLTHLTTSPRGQVTMSLMRAPMQASTIATRSMQASTT